MPYPSLFAPAGSPEPGETEIYLRFATTTNGTVGAITRQRGFGTPVRNSAGRYTLALTDNWAARLRSTIEYMVATQTSSRGQVPRVVSETLTGSTPNIVIEFLRETGVAADVDDGAVISVSFTMKNMSV
jgi:hypothetical protein